jgi:16S rRNA processing protein RimM
VNWQDLALVGRIARAHGNRGEVIVNIDTDFPLSRFRPGAELFIERNSRIEPLVVNRVRFQHGRPIIGLSGVNDIDAAEHLAGAELRVPVEQLSPLPPDTFYHHDLLGCVVEAADGRCIGVRGADPTRRRDLYNNRSVFETHRDQSPGGVAGTEPIREVMSIEL